MKGWWNQIIDGTPNPNTKSSPLPDQIYEINDIVFDMGWKKDNNKAFMNFDF